MTIIEIVTNIQNACVPVHAHKQKQLIQTLIKIQRTEFQIQNLEKIYIGERYIAWKRKNQRSRSDSEALCPYDGATTERERERG